MSVDDKLRSFLTLRRKELGLSQVEVARRMGTGQSALSDLEQGRTPDPRISTIQKWAAVLGLDATLMIEYTETIRRSIVINLRVDEGGAP